MEEMEKHLHQILNTLLLCTMKGVMKTLSSSLRTMLIKFAIENCKDKTVLQWLRENSDSEVFCNLADMFHLLKKNIDEAEQGNHGNRVDITFVAHGAIRDSMIPACCLLPLPSISDVVLYSPWNCTMATDAVYGVATGLMKPQHRVFTCSRKDRCRIPAERHQPTELPNCWNSMKKAGDHMIPNITVSPLKAPEDGVWSSFNHLSKKYGGPARNRIVIPFIVPAHSDSLQSVPLSVVMLALSLVLMSSRFQATVHLAACLGDQSTGRKFDRDYLQTQYGCTADNTVMRSSPDMFTVSWTESLRRVFG